MRLNIFLLSLFISLCIASAPSAFPALSHSGSAAPPKQPVRWLTYYTDKAPMRHFDPYELCVFDSTTHPPLVPLKQKGKILLGYISLGEVENYRPYFEAVKAEGILKEENPNWRGSFYVDIRDPRWAKRVIEELVPAILHEGFDGIMMDTLDNPIFLEAENPQKFKGLTEAAIQLVKAIRQNFPTIKIMMNRGFELLPALAPVIDMEMAEVIYTQYDFQQEKYGFQPEAAQRRYREQLKKALALNPKLEIYALDYWYANQKQKIKEIYAHQRAQGYHPYVATVDLHQIIPEPGMKNAIPTG